jgi:predicted DNA binding CopG/RHH family protein
MKKKSIEMPKFLNEAEEGEWWASRQGREFVKQKSAEPLKKGAAPKASRLVGQLNRTASIQIALRLPEPDVTKAREIAERKGMGYQTLLKMLVHEGLRREARRS